MNHHIVINFLGVFFGIILAIIDAKTKAGLGLAHNIIIPILFVILFELFFLYEFISNKIMKSSEHISNKIVKTTNEVNNLILFNKIENEDIKQHILDISKSVIELEEKQLTQAKKKIYGLYFHRINENLEECKENLHQMNKNGKAPINKKNQNYWKDGVLQNVEESVWTTNIPDHRNSFGRTNKKELIAAQKNAINRGIKITRVFVIDKPVLENEEPEDMENLKVVMQKQLEIGINVQVLPYSDIEDINSREKYARDIGYDFMILDDRLLYLTYVEGNAQSPVNLTELVNDEKLLRDAKAFRDTISKRAKSFKEWEKSLTEST